VKQRTERMRRKLRKAFIEEINEFELGDKSAGFLNN